MYLIPRYQWIERQ